MNHRHSATGKRQSIAWHGWRLEVPAEWNPLRIEGDWRRGSILLADLQRPRLGMRWGFISHKRFDALAWARRAIRDEVGEIASRQAEALPPASPDFEASTVYLETQPPGRDVWVAFSQPTHRAVELVYHAQRRDRVLAERIVPTLRDSPLEKPTPWAIFDLSCVVPAGMKLRAQHLTAGDLRLEFGDRRRLLSIRQISVAKLALSRMPLEKWLAREMHTRGGLYRSADQPSELEYRTDDGRPLRGIVRRMTRRRRFFWRGGLPRQLIVAALHDEQRNRLILLQASDPRLCEQLAPTLGCGRGEELPLPPR